MSVNKIDYPNIVEISKIIDEKIFKDDMRYKSRTRVINNCLKDSMSLLKNGSLFSGVLDIYNEDFPNLEEVPENSYFIVFNSGEYLQINIEYKGESLTFEINGNDLGILSFRFDENLEHNTWVYSKICNLGSGGGGGGGDDKPSTFSKNNLLSLEKEAISVI